MRTTVAHVMGVLLLGIGACTGLTACSSFSPAEPPLADSTLVTVLTELHLAQVRVDMMQDTTLTALRDSIFSHHGVPREQFEQALRYYSERPEAYVSLYGAVRDSLDQGRKRLMRQED